MTIDEAIKELQTLKDELRADGMPYPYASVCLGVEALKHVKGQYDPDHQTMRQLLPGETRE